MAQMLSLDTARRCQPSKKNLFPGYSNDFDVQPQFGLYETSVIHLHVYFYTNTRTCMARHASRNPKATQVALIVFDGQSQEGAQHAAAVMVIFISFSGSMQYTESPMTSANSSVACLWLRDVGNQHVLAVLAGIGNSRSVEQNKRPATA